MMIKKVSDDFYRLELRMKDDRLLWYGSSRTDVKGKYHQWMQEIKYGKERNTSVTPTRAVKEIAHLE